MPTFRFAEVQWPPLDRNHPSAQIVTNTRGEYLSPPAPAPSGTHTPEPSVAKAAVKKEEGTVLKEMQTNNQIHAGGFLAPAIASNRSREGDVPVPGSTIPAKSSASALLGELTALESRCVDLAGRLSEVVQELLSGSVTGNSLPSELTALRADVESLEKRTVDLAVSLSIPADADPGSSTLGELHATLKAAAEAEGRRDFRLLHARAAQELEDALALEYRGTDGSSPLDECQSAGRRLLEEIAGAQWPQAHPECLPLAERRHAYSRLLDLVRQGDELSDDDWQLAAETVTDSFGSRMGLAAVRRRLRVRNGAATARQEATNCPACGAQLEPGGQFCGDCGVKIDGGVRL